MVTLAHRNTRSPAAARLTAPDTEVLTKMKEDLTTRVSGCRDYLLLLSKDELEVMVSSSARGALCSNH